ncbi:MAG TPA: DHH family phosphoesterase, partial [Burkholderiaceae bacterium]|nr:DHH family phosphoesterase [Burkholderiaceae bacterium]
MKTINKWLSSLALLLASCVALAAGEPMLVVGHKNPDTDAIISAIAVADLKAKMGVAAVPIAQGLPNPETRFVLETFQLKAPAVQTSVAGREVFLIDHSDYPLAPDDLKKAEVVGLVDHHKL